MAGKTKRVQMLLETELLSRVDGRAKLENMNRTELVSRALEWYLAEEAAVEGADAVQKMLRSLIRDEINPQINRLAKMISKDTKASATSMYLGVNVLQALNTDYVTAYKNSEAKAAAYLTSKE